MDHRLKRKPFTVDLTLSPEDRTAYLVLLGDARTTLAKAREWLKAKGYASLSLGAIHRHRVFVRTDSQEAQLWTAIAANLTAVAEAGGHTLLAAGTLAKFEQVILKVLFSLKDDERLAPHELAGLAGALNKTIASRTLLDALQAKKAKRDRVAARRAERMSRPKVTPRDVAERIREVLGA